MEFRAENPGAVQYGNFINYYNFHSAEDRLALFPKDIWNEQIPDKSNDKYLVLDIGCNSGNVTQLLYPYLCNQTKKEVIILGIDIDSSLIVRARENNAYQRNVFYETLDVMAGQLDIFRGHLSQHDKIKFDAVFCLSITMWIHLNHGDNGLTNFLELAVKLSKLLIIEPQPWKCYLSAVNRMKKAKECFDHFKMLNIRNNVENDIENYLINKLNLIKVFETIPTKWNRRICFYRAKTLNYNVKLY